MIGHPDDNDKLKFVGPAGTKPLHELRYSRFNLRLGIIAEQPPRFRNVRESLRHVPRLRWLRIDFSSQVQRLLQK